MPDAGELPSALGRLSELFARRDVVLGIGLFSLVGFVLGVLGVPMFLARLPADYYSRREQRHLGMPVARSPLRIVVLIARNALGAILLVLGVLMLVLPGQGLLTLLVGLMLLDFPGKHRLERRVLRTPRVLRVVNALRARANRPPLDLDPVRDSEPPRQIP